MAVARRRQHVSRTYAALAGADGNGCVLASCDEKSGTCVDLDEPAGSLLQDERRVRHRNDLFGTSVIAAARICNEAQAGEIVVSDVVRQLLAGKGFTFVDRGSIPRKASKRRCDYTTFAGETDGLTAPNAGSMPPYWLAAHHDGDDHVGGVATDPARASFLRSSMVGVTP